MNNSINFIPSIYIFLKTKIRTKTITSVTILGSVICSFRSVFAREFGSGFVHEFVSGFVRIQISSTCLAWGVVPVTYKEQTLGI